MKPTFGRAQSQVKRDLGLRCIKALDSGLKVFSTEEQQYGHSKLLFAVNIEAARAQAESYWRNNGRTIIGTKLRELKAADIHRLLPPVAEPKPNVDKAIDD